MQNIHRIETNKIKSTTKKDEQHKPYKENPGVNPVFANGKKFTFLIAY